MFINGTDFVKFIITVFVSCISVIGILKLLGTKQIEHIYNINLEKYKNKIGLEFDKTQRINQKEFEVLNEVWNKAVIVRDVFLGMCLNQINITIDLNRFSPSEFDKFINDLTFPEFEKSVLRNAVDRNDAYREILINGGFNTLNRTYHEYQNYMSSNRLFVVDEIESKLFELKNYYHETMSIFLQISFDQNAKNILYKDVENKTNQILKDLSRMIQKRINFS